METKSTSYSCVPIPQVRRAYIFFHTFFSLLLWIPIYYEYQKLSGLSDKQIFDIQAYYYIAFLLLEIPTGNISDRFGHHRAMIMGAFVLFISNLIPIFSLGWWAFALHFFLIAMSRSLISGAASAYLYDYLLANDNIDAFKEIEGASRSYGLYAKIACWTSVGLLMNWYRPLPYIITAFNAFVALCFALWLPKVPVVKSISKGKQSFISALNNVRQTPLLRQYILLGVAMFIMIRVCQINLFQPLLKSKGFDVASFGWIMALMTIFESIGAKNAYKIKGMQDRTIVFFATSIICLAFFLVVGQWQVITILGFCIFSLAAGVAFPIQRKLLNDAIVNPENRATLLSIESIVDRGATALVVFLIGGLVEKGQLTTVFHYIGIGSFLFVAFIHYRTKKLNFQTLPS